MVLSLLHFTWSSSFRVWPPFDSLPPIHPSSPPPQIVQDSGMPRELELYTRRCLVKKLCQWKEDEGAAGTGCRPPGAFQTRRNTTPTVTERLTPTLQIETVKANSFAAETQPYGHICIEWPFFLVCQYRLQNCCCSAKEILGVRNSALVRF